MKTIKQKLQSRGFDHFIKGLLPHTIYAITKAEPYDAGKDHFTPRGRDVFLGKCHWSGGGFGFYVTSNILGTMRRYRSRHTNQISVANIFASGKTKHEAIDNFLHNFDKKIYNDGKRGGISACEKK